MKNPYALILLVAATTAYGQINNPPTSVNIVDSTATGRAVLTATNSAAAATAIGLGTANEVTFNRVQVGGASFSADDFSGGNFVVTGGHALTFSSGGTSGATLTNLGLGATNNVEFRRLKMIAADAYDDADNATLWLDTSGTNKAAAMRLSGTGGAAEKYNAYLQATSFGLQVSAGNGFRVLSGPTAGVGSVLFAVNSSGNATLNGVNNTAPSQTASSGSSLMTRDLSDDRYGAWENTFEISNFSGLTAGIVSGGATTITPGYTAVRVTSGGGYRSMFSLYRGSLTGLTGFIQSGSRSTRAVVGNEIESRVYSAFYPVLGAVSSQWAGRGVGLATSAGVLPYFLYYDSAWRAIKATFVRGSASVYPVRASDVITIESNGAHNLTTNDFVSVAGVFPQSMQTWRAAVLSTPTANSFTYANVGADETGTTILGDNMNISKIEELGTNAVTVVANQFSGVVTRDFRVDVSADGTADFYINGSNIATGTGFWVTGGNNTARMGFGLESQTDATTVSDINIYKASHTINP